MTEANFLIVLHVKSIQATRWFGKEKCMTSLSISSRSLKAKGLNGLLVVTMVELIYALTLSSFSRVPKAAAEENLWSIVTV